MENRTNDNTDLMLMVSRINEICKEQNLKIEDVLKNKKSRQLKTVVKRVPVLAMEMLEENNLKLEDAIWYGVHALKENPNALTKKEKFNEDEIVAMCRENFKRSLQLEAKTNERIKALLHVYDFLL